MCVSSLPLLWTWITSNMSLYVMYHVLCVWILSFVVFFSCSFGFFLSVFVSLFSSLATLRLPYSWHTSWTSSWNGCIISSSRAGIGDLFDMLLPMLVIYQEYVRNHHFSLQVLAECKQKDVFVKMLRRLEEKPVLQGRTLETFLTYPMHQVWMYSSSCLCIFLCIVNACLLSLHWLPNSVLSCSNSSTRSIVGEVGSGERCRENEIKRNKKHRATCRANNFPPFILKHVSSIVSHGLSPFE